jgi:hypothetical protein
MNKALFATKQHFESSSSKTPEYLAWHRLFKKEFTLLLKNLGAIKIEIGKPNHFDMSGFFQMGTGQIWYFSISDIRWSKDSMLIRAAESFKDYKGGYNQYIALSVGGNIFASDLNNIISKSYSPFEDSRKYHQSIA